MKPSLGERDWVKQKNCVRVITAEDVVRGGQVQRGVSFHKKGEKRVRAVDGLAPDKETRWVGKKDCY